MIVRDFLICLLQMYLLEDLEKNMLPYRRENFWGKFLIYFVVALIMLGINHLESSIFNMVIRRLRNATSRINTAFFVTYKQITPHRIWYNRVD